MKFDANANETSNSGSVQGVQATAGGLVLATLGAATVAGAILTFVWLPAEYGIDPTGVGDMLGLTQMGEIKAQLQADAVADAVAVASAEPAVQSVRTDSDAAIAEKLDAIQVQLSAIATTIGVGAITTGAEPMVAPTDQTPTSDQSELKTANSEGSASPWRDEVEYTLVPGEGIEVKLVMEEGAVAEFEWSANGAVLNHDTHGDGNGQSISYEKGRSVPEQTGQLTAAFTGNHGWYWRNRTDDDVVVSLRARGDYSGLVLP